MTKLQKNLFMFVALMSSAFGQISCTRVISTVRQMAQEAPENSYTSQSSKSPKLIKTLKVRDDRPFADFQREILADFKNENFDAIDQKANQARRGKERFTGGYWKINILYDALATIYGEEFQTEQRWKTHLETALKWKQKSPDSVTARIVLAQSYTNYGWFARGTGFSNTVKGEDQDKLNERLELAEQELKDAEKLKDKCPEWYEAMLFLAMARSWDAADYNKLLAEAVAFEPDYYYYHYSAAENSLPRWSGEAGDLERYAESVAKVDSPEQNIIYYLYASFLFSNYYSHLTNPQSINWEKAKQGYKELEKKYGIDKKRLNQYSFIAAAHEDMPEAYQAFRKIGDDWDDEVYAEKRFNELKSWAIARYEAENKK